MQSSLSVTRVRRFKTFCTIDSKRYKGTEDPDGRREGPLPLFLTQKDSPTSGRVVEKEVSQVLPIQKGRGRVGRGDEFNPKLLKKFGLFPVSSSFDNFYKDQIISYDFRFRLLRFQY